MTTLSPKGKHALNALDGEEDFNEVTFKSKHKAQTEESDSEEEGGQLQGSDRQHQGSSRLPRLQESGTPETRLPGRQGCPGRLPEGQPARHRYGQEPPWSQRQEKTGRRTGRHADRTHRAEDSSKEGRRSINSWLRYSTSCKEPHDVHDDSSGTEDSEEDTAVDRLTDDSGESQSEN